MLYAGLDLSRKRLDVHVLREDGTTALVTAVWTRTAASAGHGWAASARCVSIAAATAAPASAKTADARHLQPSTISGDIDAR